ncbi:hypothetical protein N0398_22185 [Providencia rettgeri]|nr:hypothetical protein [Providencia rettgeri]
MSKIFTKPRSESEEMLPDFRWRHLLSEEHLNFLDEFLTENKKRKGGIAIRLKVFCDKCGMEADFYEVYVINIGETKYCNFCLKKQEE